MALDFSENGVLVEEPPDFSKQGELVDFSAFGEPVPDETPSLRPDVPAPGAANVPQRIAQPFLGTIPSNEARQQAEIETRQEQELPAKQAELEESGPGVINFDAPPDWRVTAQELETLGLGPTTSKVAAGLQQSVADAASFFFSPDGIQTLGLAALPGAAGKAAVASFTIDMAQKEPEIIRNLAKAWREGDTETAARLAGEGALNTLFVAGGAKHVAGRALPEISQAIGLKLSERARDLETAKVADDVEARRFLTPPPLSPEVKAMLPRSAAVVEQIPAKASVEAMAKVEELSAPSEIIKEPAKEVTSVESTRTPEPVGMGGAVPSEFVLSPQTATGIKNAAVDAQRLERGLEPIPPPETLTDKQVHAEAMAKIDMDPGWQDRLISELSDRPRAMTPHETVAMLQRETDLRNEYAKATRDLAQAFDDGRVQDLPELNARATMWSDKMSELEKITGRGGAGTESGRSLRWRRTLMKEDYSLAQMELSKRADLGGRPLTAEERVELTKAQQEIERTQKAYDEYVAKSDQRIAELEAARVMAELKAKANEPPPQIARIVKRIGDTIHKRGDAARARLRGKTFTLSPEVLKDLAEVGADNIFTIGEKFTEWSIKMIEDIGEHVRPYLRQVWDASRKNLDDAVDKLASPKSQEPVRRTIKKQDIAAQRNDLKTRISERVASGDSSEITGLVQKLARGFVEQGVNTRDVLIDAVHGVLKEVIPDISRRDTMDAISGYGQFKQLTKDEISIRLRDLKGQMQQVAKLEDMQANQPPLKTGLERRIPSTEESRLIRLVNEAKNQFQIPISDPNTQLKSSLDTLKARLRNETSRLEDKLARKDFTVKPKRIVQMDAEANRLHFENSKAKLKWHESRMKDRLANRTFPEKLIGSASEVLNTSRALLTSLDLSAVLRQGGFIALAHPLRAAKSFPAMFRALRSEAGQHAVNQEILKRKNYPLYVQSKLYLAEHGHKLSQMEEAYMSRWADKIPLVAASQRAYVTFLNKLRADSFDAMANTLARNRELSPEEAKAIANFVNVATGRGNLGMKDNALVGLNTIFFAPRYVASRFQILAGQPMYRGTARTRIAIAKEYARFLIGAAVVYSLAQLDGAEVESDPRSSDFGKLKYGNTRVDPMAGLIQSTVLLSRLYSGEAKQASGKISPIRGDKVKYGGTTASDVTWRFLRSKLAPVPGQILNLAAGENVVGEPATPGTVAKDLLVPLSMGEILKTMEEQGIPRGTALSILSLFGMGLQNYDAEKPKKK